MILHVRIGQRRGRGCRKSRTRRGPSMSPHAAQLRAWLPPPAAGTLGADDERQLQLEVGLLWRRASRPTMRRPQPSAPGGLGLPAGSGRLGKGPLGGDGRSRCASLLRASRATSVLEHCLASEVGTCVC